MDINKELIFHKMWEQHEYYKTSTLAELAAVEFSALLAFAEVLKGSHTLSGLPTIKLLLR